MLNTIKLIDLIKKLNNGCSDYRVAKLLSVSTASASVWRTGKGTMSDAVAAKAAKLAGLDESYVVACINAERHNSDDTFPIWQQICDRLEPHRKAA